MRDPVIDLIDAVSNLLKALTNKCIDGNYDLDTEIQAVHDAINELQKEDAQC